MDRLKSAISRAERTSMAATRLAKQTGYLAAQIAQLDAADYATHHEVFVGIIQSQALALAKANREFLALTTKFDTIKAQSAETKMTADDLADFTADSVLIETQVQSLERLSYIAWAQHTVRLEPSLFRLAIKEILSLSNGKKTLSLLCDDIAEALANDNV